MLPGFGVNYKAAQANWDADISYFKSIGLNSVRQNLRNFETGQSSAWVPPGAVSAGSYEFWRNCAVYFKDNGFYTSWGPCTGRSAPNLTATVWAQYHDDVVADAAYMQAQGIKLDVYELGNEEEAHVDGTTLTIDQLIINLKQLATDVKAVYTLSPIGYALYDTSSTTYDKWITAGRGNIDILALHPYSNLQNSGRGLSIGGYSVIPKMIKAFGADHCTINEFGLEANDTNLTTLSAGVKMAAMKDRKKFINSLGFTRSIMYTYVGYLNGDNQFAMKKTDGSFDPTWTAIISDNTRLASVTY